MVKRGKYIGTRREAEESEEEVADEIAEEETSAEQYMEAKEWKG